MLFKKDSKTFKKEETTKGFIKRNENETENNENENHNQKISIQSIQIQIELFHHQIQTYRKNEIIPTRFNDSVSVAF